nr:MAG TPA: hypothetical protein [Caudoviricetes sp.]
MKKYTIELTEKQLKGLAYACRVTDRLILGQLDFSLRECCEAAWERRHKDSENLIDNPKWWEMRDEVERHINELRMLCWGQERGTFNGVYYDEFADMLFDIQKVIEHLLWLEIPADKKNNCTNNAFPPEQISNEPLMTINSK